MLISFAFEIIASRNEKNVLEANGILYRSMESFNQSKNAGITSIKNLCKNPSLVEMVLDFSISV